MVDINTFIITFIAFICLIYYFFSRIIGSFSVNLQGINLFNDNLMFSI